MTKKASSIIFTIGWAMALTFGWIALAAPPSEPELLRAIDVTLAALGAGAGVWSWLRIRAEN